MPHDPDFHETAAAWLDGTGNAGAPRVLREILHDAPDTAVEFAALARAEAALQLAAFTPAARLQRARRMIEPSPAMRLRRFTARPAFRVAAAAVVLLAGAVWWFASRSAGPADDPGKPRLAPKQPVETSPGLVRSSLPPEKLPPADKDFARRMGRFIVPEFKATGVPLADALDALRKNIAAIDDTAVPDFSAAPELPDDLKVHLHLTYQPVAVLVEVIAIQTGTKFEASGKGYVIAVNAKAPPPGRMQETYYENDILSRLPFGIPRDVDNAEPVAAFVTRGLERCLGESPGMPVIPKPDEEYFLRVSATQRLHRMIILLGNTVTGAMPPGEQNWSLKAVEITGAEALAKFTELTGDKPQGARFNDAEFQLLMRSLSMLKGVDLAIAPLMSTRPGQIASALAGKESADPGNAPDDWTGIRHTVKNKAEGDAECVFDFVIESRLAVPPNADGTPAAPRYSSSSGSARLYPGQTMLAHSEQSKEGSLIVYFLTANNSPPEELTPPQDPPPDAPEGDANPPAPQDDLPYGIPVVDKAGFVYSPYAPDKGFIDVEGLKRGTRVSCPYTQKHFRVP